MAQIPSFQIASPQVYNEHVLALGKDLVIRLQILLKLCGIHERNNVALVRPSERLVETLAVFHRTAAEVALRLSRDFLYIDEVRVRYDIETATSYNYLLDEMKRRRIGAISFKGPVDAVTARTFGAVFVGIETTHPDPPYEMQKRLVAGNCFSITVEAYDEPPEQPLDTIMDERKRAKRTYFRAISSLKGIVHALKEGQAVELRRVKRSVQSIIDVMLREEFSLLGLTTLKDYDEYLYNHCINVSIFALTLGKRLGLPKSHLTNLGVSSVFHDIGKIEIPHEIIDKPTEFTEEDWRQVKEHPSLGVKILSRIRGLNDLTMVSMVVSFEHHLRHDSKGYPALRSRAEWDMHFFSRIVALADQYDAMTSSRVYQRVPFSPDKALSVMAERSGTHFEPALLKVFVNMVGIYPIGTLLLLDTKELALVFDTNPTPANANRPRVLVITDTSGNQIEARTADLTEIDARTGRHKRSVVKVLDVHKYNINLAEYFI